MVADVDSRLASSNHETPEHRIQWNVVESCTLTLVRAGTRNTSMPCYSVPSRGFGHQYFRDYVYGPSSCREAMLRIIF
jgi:hypothetical protein